jgi:molecular chaperone DnaK
MDVIGIDLGTTNTVAARVDRIMPMSEDEQSVLPSVVAFLPNGTTQVGRTARRRRVIDFENTIFSSKRIIGRRWSDSATAGFRERYPFSMVEGPDGMPLFETRSGDHSATQIAGLVLREVARWTQCDRDGVAVRITIPAVFNAAQRQETLAAARLAGLRDVRLISETLASVHAYRTLETGLGRTVVYDLGGGTFDCSIVDCSRDEPELLSHSADLFLGGDDIDEQLACWVRDHVLETHNWDLWNYREIRDRLVSRCEETKIQLSRKETARLELSQVDPECPAADEGVEVSRRLLDDLCQDLVRRSFLTCDDALRSAGLHVGDVDTVLLAGGTTLLPMVQQSVESYFGKAGRLDFDPCEVVARGAGLAAHGDGEPAPD